MQSVVREFGDRRIRIWGNYKPWYKNPWRWLTRERRDIYTNRNTTAAVLNAEYNRARIVINIHHEQQTDGANPKCYEIAASGALQICDSNPYIDQLFAGTEVMLYHDEAELIDQIRRALDSPPSTGSARERILAHHTFVARMREVCAVMASVRPRAAFAPFHSNE